MKERSKKKKVVPRAAGKAVRTSVPSLPAAPAPQIGFVALPPVLKPKSELYEGIRNRANTRIMAESREARDISPIPAVVNPARRAKGIASLEFFLKTYFPEIFVDPFSDDQLDEIRLTEKTIREGGQAAKAAPRGDGKTTRLDHAALWAVLGGYRRFVLCVGATAKKAQESMKRMKSELEHNDLLLEDFPKACYPIRRLEGQSRRCVGQLCKSKRTEITWLPNKLVLPTIDGPENEASGAVLATTGITGAFRGLLEIDPQGKQMRPDLLLIDDPQTRASAKSKTQTSHRLSLISADLMGLAGPKQKISAMIACTVIYAGDLSDQLLDRTLNPEWQGVRSKMVYAFPTNQALWDEYAAIRNENLHADGTIKRATAFYRKHRAAMDLGAEISWKSRFNEDELSAIQHAMNLRLKNASAFASEYQNEPLQQTLAAGLDARSISCRLNGYPRAVAGPAAEKLIAFIDVGQEVHWDMVCAFSEDVSADIIEYDAFPKQPTRIFTKRNASNKLSLMFPGAGKEGAIYAGLSTMVSQLLTRQWLRSDGAALYISRILIDSGKWPDVVRQFIRQSQFRQALIPTKGVGIGPAQRAIAEYDRKKGEKIGADWILGKAGADRLRLLRFDANRWKTRVAGMLNRPMGTSNIITLYGDKSAEHELISQHLSSEVPTPTTAKGVTIDIWTKIPDRENEGLDLLVGCCVGASLEGFSPLHSVAQQTGIAVSAARPAAKKRYGAYYQEDME